MKIGDYVTIQEIKNQSVCRWVVLTNLRFVDYGDYEGVDGGVVNYIADTKDEAGDAWCNLDDDAVGGTLLLCGALPEYELCVGGVIVE